MRTNRRTNFPTTHAGAPAAIIKPEAMLRRSVMSCFLWEDEFYEDGQSISERIGQLVAQLPPERVATVALEARSVANLRHVPLLLAAHLAKPASGQAGPVVKQLLTHVVQRADELAEFLAIYSKVYNVQPNKLKPHLAKQVQRGLAGAIAKFDEHALSRYGRYEKGSAVKLADVIKLCHPRPKDAAQAGLWKRVIDYKGSTGLTVAETWENEMIKDTSASAGSKTQDKGEVFTRLLKEGKLGYLALLRNLRNMDQAGVDTTLIEENILARKRGAQRVLPFRYVAAAQAAPRFEKVLDMALLAALGEAPVLPGKTVVLVDRSGSMSAPVSGKSDISRATAAATLASMINGQVRVFAFADTVKEVPHRLGMSGVDAIARAAVGSSTYVGRAVGYVQKNYKHDRMIVITDEQSWDPVPDPVADHAYMLNVASYQNGVGYGKWVHVDGFSESVLRFVREYEATGF